MNFYQRANLNMGLAIAVALINSSTNFIVSDATNSIKISELSVHLGWMLFQFFFGIKVLIDDHRHFEEKTYKERFPRSKDRFFDFLFFIFFGFFCISAASFSNLLHISMYLFVIGLIVATIWVGYNYDGPMYISYFISNILYLLIIISYINRIYFESCIIFYRINLDILFILLIFGALIYDVIVSKTYEIMA